MANELPEPFAIKRLISFIRAGGPEENEYDEMTNLWDTVNINEVGPIANIPKRNDIINLFDCDFLNQTIQGFGYRKPHGYSGDFEIIDNMYQYRISENHKFQKWDKYFHSLHATRAVRNRKSYFIKLVTEKLLTMSGPLRILNVASGPCRDVFELFETIPFEKLQIHCIEKDPKANEYARNLLGPLTEIVEITQKNIFRFSTTDKFDLIWSAGLFDYFDDRAFIMLLSKFNSWCGPSGEIVIGNFSIHNPNRSYMEKAANWYLFHRTNEGLKQLAVKAGFKNSQIEIKSEILGVNLFLHIKSD